MAYDPNSPYEPSSRRAYPPQLTPQDPYLDNSPIEPPSGRPYPPQARGGGGGGGGYQPAPRGYPPPNEYASPQSPPQTPRYAPNDGLADDMANMNMRGDPRGPPGPPRGGLRGRGPGPNRGPAPFVNGGRGGGPRGGGPPGPGFHGRGDMRGDMRVRGGPGFRGRAGPPPDRMRQEMGPGDRSAAPREIARPPTRGTPGPPAPERPGIQRSNTGNYDGGWSGHDNAGPLSPGFGPPARSRTMPAEQEAPQQYMAYNPAMHGTPVQTTSAYSPPPSSSGSGSANGYQPYDPYQENDDLGDLPPVPKPFSPTTGPRESVTAVLESYYDSPNQSPYQSPKRNFSRPSLDHSASQPSLPRNSPLEYANYEGGYDGSSEPNGQRRPSEYSQSPLRTGQSDFTSPISQQSPYRPYGEDPYQAPPGTQRMSDPDALPAHPPPVRPGLMQDAQPQRPPERASVSSLVTADATPVTWEELKQLRYAVTKNPIPSIQLTLAKKLVEASNVLASENGKADAKTTRKNRESFIHEADKLVRKLSKEYPDAKFYLASCYGDGSLGLQIDHDRAFSLYLSAAQMNHPAAAYRTAVCCELGAGTRKDPEKAMSWYRKAAALKETPAMFKLGMIQLKGLLGQHRNPRDGITWLKRAAEQADVNNAHALHELALLYSSPANSEIVIPDADYARELFERAAELGYAESQFRLGAACEYNLLNCESDSKASIYWYSQAAKQEHLEAMLALSGWYLTGAEPLLQQSDTEAYLWARKAAEKGLAKAEYALGYYTEVGIGVPRSIDEAKRWYYKAAKQHPKAQQRLHELNKGGSAVQKNRERLSRSNAKQRGEEGDCIIM